MWHTVYLSKWSVFIQRKGGRIFEQLWRFFSSDHPTVVKTPVSSRPQCRQDPSVVKTPVSSRPQCRQDPSVVKSPVSSRPQCRQGHIVVKTPVLCRSFGQHQVSRTSRSPRRSTLCQQDIHVFQNTQSTRCDKTSRSQAQDTLTLRRDTSLWQSVHEEQSTRVEHLFSLSVTSCALDTL